MTDPRSPQLGPTPDETEFAALIAIERSRVRRSRLVRVTVSIAIIAFLLAATVYAVAIYLPKQSSTSAESPGPVPTPQRTAKVPIRAAGFVNRGEESASDLQRYFAQHLIGASDPRVGLFRQPATHRAEFVLVVYSADPDDAIGRRMLTSDDPTLLLDSMMIDTETSNLVRPAVGPMGGATECGRVRDDGATLPFCAWVDQDTFGLLLWLHAESPRDAAKIAARVRAASEHRR